MPLRAVHQTGSIQAYELDFARWHEIKNNYKSLGLRMPCCGEPAIPKTSKLGTFFFAHQRKGDCKTAPESAEHIFCKEVIAKAAKTAGWEVTTEFAGKTSTGDDWVADVYCTKDTMKIALEVQMSKQNSEETRRRQQRYQASGVRCAWFFGPASLSGVKEHYFREDTPVFVLKDIQPGQEPQLVSFDATLGKFVVALLSKRVTWHTDAFELVHQIGYFEDSCFKCKRPIKQIYDHLIEDASPMHSAPERPSEISDVLGYLSEEFLNHELTAMGLNPIGIIKQIQGTPARWPYANICRHCGSPQSNYFLSKKVQETKATMAEPNDPFLDSLPVGNGFGIKHAIRKEKGRSYWRYLADQTDHPKAG
jgi:hypothetical protein